MHLTNDTHKSNWHVHKCASWTKLHRLSMCRYLAVSCSAIGFPRKASLLESLGKTRCFKNWKLIHMFCKFWLRIRDKMYTSSFPPSSNVKSARRPTNHWRNEPTNQPTDRPTNRPPSKHRNMIDTFLCQLPLHSHSIANLPILSALWWARSLWRCMVSLPAVWVPAWTSLPALHHGPELYVRNVRWHIR